MIKAVKYQAFDLQFKKVRFRIKQVDKLNQFFYNFILYFIFEKERNTGEICIMEKGERQFRSISFPGVSERNAV